MNSIFHYCQGESHKSTGKPCQDYCFAMNDKTLSIAVVADGHGGERYFRSQYGSQKAVEITVSAIQQFVNNVPESNSFLAKKTSCFDGKPFTEFCEANSKDEQLDSLPHKRLMWLFSSIISQWNIAIAQDARERNLDDWELEHVEKKYIDEFIAGREDDNATFEKTYGCTLMAYVQTRSYWFAFQLGDGKCVFLNDLNGCLSFSQPIPWDERCFLNKTTSICDSDALSEIRYCFQGDGNFPIAVFLGSDGIDDTYGDGELLYNFYIEIFKLLLTKDKASVQNDLVEQLPQISAIGSKDDMSVAIVYNDCNKELYLSLLKYQIQKLKEKIFELELKASDLQLKINAFGDPEALDKSSLINYNYATNDLQKLQSKIIHCKKKIQGYTLRVNLFLKAH